MTQTLEQMISPGSNIFEQPIFSKVFDGMAQAIRDTSKNPGIEQPANLELYQMLVSRLNGFVAFRNNVAEFKKRAGIRPSIRLAQTLSLYIIRQIFKEYPSFQEYLVKYAHLGDGIVPDGAVPTYKFFKSSYSGNQA